MPSLRTASVAFILALSILASNVQARLMPGWSLSQLLEKSDLVIIAKAVQTKDSKENWKGPETPPGNTVFGGVETTFEPGLVIKSPLKDGSVGKVVLVHFELRLIDPGQGYGFVNGHSFVHFETKPYNIELRDAEGSRGCTYAPTYLLFLHQRPDGKFEPVTGQYDASYSVRAVHETYLGDLLTHMEVKK